MGGKVYGCATISGARVLSEAEFRVRLGPDCPATPGGADPVLAPARRRWSQHLPEDGRGRSACTAQSKGGGKKKRQRSALPRGQSRLGLAAPTQLDSQAGEREAGETAAASGEKVDNEGEAK